MRLDYAHSQKLQRVNWAKSKRLLNQSLILLSNDKFKSIYLATICRQAPEELRTEGTFGIAWEGKRPEFSSGSYFDILECDVYFETYR